MIKAIAGDRGGPTAEMEAEALDHVAATINAWWEMRTRRAAPVAERS